MEIYFVMRMKSSNLRTQLDSHQSRTEIPSIITWMGINNTSVLILTTLISFTMVSGLAVVLKEHQNRTALNELQELKDERNELEVKWGQLLIEQSTFGVEGRVEQKAVDDLKMQIPTPAEIIMVNYE